MKYKVIREGATCKLIRMHNGFYAIYLDRRSTQSLKTRDKALAMEKFRAKDRRRREQGLAGDNRLSTIRLKAFMDEYLGHRFNLVCLYELAEATLKADRVALDSLLRCLGDIPLARVQHQVEAYKVKMLAGSGDLEKRKNSINTYLRHLSSAFAWASCPDRSTGRPAYIKTNPFAETRTEKVKFRGIQRLPKYISLDDISAMREALQRWIRDHEKFSWRMGKIEGNLEQLREFRMLFEMLLHTGLRISELVRLDWKDVDLKEKLIHIREAKARKERMVAMPEALVSILWAYGWQDIGKVCKYDADKVRALCKRVGQRAMLGKGITPHRLRHSYGTYAAHFGVPLDVIQANLGHASIKTTEIYKDVLVSRQQDGVRDLAF